MKAVLPVEIEMGSLSSSIGAVDSRDRLGLGSIRPTQSPR